MFLLVSNACWQAVQIRLYEGPVAQVEAGLLAICVLLFVALRVHITPISYVIGAVPPALTLIWSAIDWGNPLALNHYALSMILFVAAGLLVTWRQQATDRTLTQALRDLTRKNVALTQAIDEAKAASRAKTDLLAVASHEIRTPLNAVLGFAQILREKDLTPEQADLCSGVLEGGEQLTRLLDGILDLANLEGRQARLNPVPVDLRRMIHAVMRVWSAHARDIGVDFRFEDADPTLSFHVRADEVRVEQTLVNLVSNAMGAAASGGRVAVRLAGTPKGEDLSVLIEVSDTGPAVPPEDRLRLFEAFHQTARGLQQGGSGLGLSICARNTALMGGEIGIADPASAATGGAVFWFAFAAPVHIPPLAAPAGTARDLSQIRLLAAEDNPANRKVLAFLLKETPVSLTFAEDGAQALDAWRAQPFDLILIDVNMLVLSGLDAVREIRKADSPGTRTPIWMLTAKVFDDDIALYRETGADGVLRKPINLPALFTLLAQVAEGLTETPA
ncbi:ATP-binding protein [Caulobacter sp. DWR1-3-2b1]|uniref:ATP-binding protein n=1 Tax=Caulobacter sp. DWR1-3-2b1 TaxID=2804670 RepID=UPI003CEF5B39